MKIATASLNQTPLDWVSNKNNILQAIKLASDNKSELLCLPELCITGYGCEDMFLHPWVSEKALSILFEILPATKDITIILGLPIWHNEKLYNASCLIQRGNILGFQAKQHLPYYGVHYEPRWFSAWPAEKKDKIEINGQVYLFGDSTYQIDGIKLGFEICEDAWVKDRPACRLVNEQVNIILNPSASHFAIMKSVLREQKVIEASKEFNCTYVFANQLGNEAGRIIYDGDAVIAHKGNLVASTKLFSFETLGLVQAEINYEKDEIVSKAIEADHANDEVQFVAAVSLGLFDYLRKSRSQGFVISLSGGADSSACLVLVVEMIRRACQQLGVDKFKEKIGLKLNSDSIEEIVNALVTVAYQATTNSSAKTFNSAKSLAESVNATFYKWNIDESLDSAQQIIENATDKQLSWQTDDIVLQNIQARNRSPLIWMLANLKNALLITTSNRSEGSVGYATMDGDTSGSLAPIAGVSKSFIREWLKWAEINLGYSALTKVNSLVPSAELRPQGRAQSDESDLMPYDILNQIEELFIAEQLSPQAIHQKLSEKLPESEAATYIIKFFELWSKNQWKRERLAPSFQLSKYNIDPRSWFRFPILSSGFKNELDIVRKYLR